MGHIMNFLPLEKMSTCNGIRSNYSRAKDLQAPLSHPRRSLPPPSTPISSAPFDIPQFLFSRRQSRPPFLGQISPRRRSGRLEVRATPGQPLLQRNQLLLDGAQLPPGVLSLSQVCARLQDNDSSANVLQRG